MKRVILAILAGIVTWIVVASLFDRALRLALPGYAAAEPDMTFTVPMMAARLTMGALSSLAAGYAAGWIDRPAGPSAWTVALVLLGGFLPGHMALWHLFPVWYHLTFLVSLVPLTWLGSCLAHLGAPGRRAGGAAGGPQQA